jgi:DNA-binding NarL/FixJ family response regulator
MNHSEIKILLVDDHRLMREGIRAMLLNHSTLRVVGEADSRLSALEQVRAIQPDVVVMDIHLPGENGIEISTQILTEFPRTKIIILSGDIELPSIQKALQIGVTGYLSKNDPPEEIVRAIQDVMDQRVYLCRDVAAIVAQDYVKTVVNQTTPGKPVLSERELLLLRLIAEGKRNKEIADTLQVTAKSVETYRSRLMHKLNCNSTAELTRYALREGISTL